MSIPIINGLDAFYSERELVSIDKRSSSFGKIHVFVRQSPVDFTACEAMFLWYQPKGGGWPEISETGMTTNRHQKDRAIRALAESGWTNLPAPERKSFPAPDPQQRMEFVPS